MTGKSSRPLGDADTCLAACVRLAQRLFGLYSAHVLTPEQSKRFSELLDDLASATASHFRVRRLWFSFRKKREAIAQLVVVQKRLESLMAETPYQW